MLEPGISMELSPGEYTSLAPPFHMKPAVAFIYFFKLLLMSLVPVDEHCFVHSSAYWMCHRNGTCYKTIINPKIEKILQIRIVL